MARIPRRFSAAVSQVQDKLGGFSERFTASKKPQPAAESGAGGSAPQSSRTSEGGANPWRSAKSWFAKFFRPDNPSIALRVSLSGALVVLLFSLTSGAITFAVSYEQAQEAQDERLEEVVGMLARTKAAFSRQPPSFQAFFMDDDVFANGCLTKTIPEPDCPPAPTSSSKRFIKTAERCMPAFGIFCPTAITP